MSDEEQVRVVDIDIASLPDAVLRLCFSFVGSGNFRFVAGVNHCFRNAYSINNEEEATTGFQSKTTWKSAASSLPRAQLCFKDWKEKTEEEKGYVLEVLSSEASRMGRIDVLKWARTNGFEIMPVRRHFVNLHPEEHVFEIAAKHGHVRVLEWAQGLHLDWYSDVEIQFAAGNGDTSVFEGRDLPGYQNEALVYSVIRIAVHNEQLKVLRWLKDHGLLDSSFNNKVHIWEYAVEYGSIKTLDWALENGCRYHLDTCFVVRNAIRYDSQNMVKWAYDHGAERNISHCKLAAEHGNLGMLQYLRENDCPWDSDVIREARRGGHDHVASWARENGCPEP